MRILVTGSSGFIGGRLVERLRSRGDWVLTMDKKDGLSTVQHNLLKSIVGDDGVDLIVHLGANCSSQRSLREPYQDFTDNVVGTFNVCNVARKYGIRVIFNSTMKVYRGADGVLSPYGLSKQMGEMYLREFGKLYGLEYIINRPSSVYGPTQDASVDGGWFTHFINCFKNTDPITLFGDGTQSRDVLYVEDHIDLLIDEIDNFDLYKGKAYDFGGGIDNEVSLNELFKYLNYYPATFKESLPGDVVRFVCDNVKINAVNGWLPKTSWQKGVAICLNG